MTKRVALFFDDAELGSHLRAALSEHGAQIVHEGPLKSFDEARARTMQVDVLVVNLDDAVDEAALDRIYELVGSGDVPVVFNDAQASRGLDGWDRARWARHLAAKTLDSDMTDPPRPEDARGVEAPATSTEMERSVEAAMLAEPMDASLAETVQEHVEAQPDSETLAAELEALLASDEAQPTEENEFGSGLTYREEGELPPLHDGDFGSNEIAFADAQDDATSAGKREAAEAAPKPAGSATFNINLDHLSLASLDEETVAPEPEKASLAQPAPTHVAPEWGFVEEGETPASQAPAEASHKPFGIEKMSAADYLAPDVAHLEGEAAPIEPGMSLELVSIEEAIAPSEQYEPYETHLYELDAALSRLLVLGAASDSHASLSSFLAVLPGDLKWPVLLTQHQGDAPIEHLVASLETQCALPLKAASQGMRMHAGEVVVVPRGQQVKLTRDGRVDVSPLSEDASGQSPSIDSSFTMAASVFGRDALAVIFAGKGTDAVAGAQAIHDRGGQVWVESSSDHYTDMVNGVLAERLASFSGSAQELALRLVEDFR